MSPNREEVLLAMVLEKSVAERPAFLAVLCGENDALHQRLESLLSRHEPPDDVLVTPDDADLPTIKLDPVHARDEAVGQTLGRYKLLERVGEGGCGVVYVAEQTQPVRRRVALKVIKLGMDTREVIARFEAERQALAMMDHPNIARVLDAGTTELGRPYFVMELVRGIPITDYCDQANLHTKERLDLFIKVCQAIQHAHQKGIIHRDIKPSNILVTLHDGVPVPKVIDFGIAKATEGRLTDSTVYTQLNQFIGTPAYMSPEQAEMSGLDIDTRSDIYSLGVLLYELLAGSTPFDAKDLIASGIDAMRKTIREKEPPRPSTRLATLGADQLTTTAKRRSADTSKLLHQLQGDLDWIVMKCLEKDRQRRYETANGLAADIKRHLGNEPVTARPPSAAYRFQKAFRRNKMVFAAGTAIAAALLLGVIASSWQSVRATRAQREALSARVDAETNEKKAVESQLNESRLRAQAQSQELAARQRAYASDMNVAKQALDGNNLGRALDLLNRQRPEAGQKDLRGWEWRYLWQQTHSDALFTLCQQSSEINSLAVSPKGEWLAVGVRHGGGLSLWDVRTRREVIRLAKDESFIRAAFSPAEPLLAYVSSAYSPSTQVQHTLRIYNTATQRLVGEFPSDNACVGLAFAKDGQTLVTSTFFGEGGLSSLGGLITLWRVSDGAKLASFPSEQSGMDAGVCFAAAADLSVAAYGLDGGRLRVVDLRGGKELWTALASKEFITALAFSADGRTLASAAGFAESDIRLWEVATGKQIGQLTGHSSYVSSIAFWPDGKRLASSSADQTLRTWDLTSQQCVDVLRGHRQEVWRSVLLPDHRTLVSGSKDGAVCFWDTSIAHSRRPHIAIPEKIVSWSITPDSRSIVALNYEGQVSQWSGEDFQRKTPLFEIGETFPDRDRQYRFSRDARFLAAGSTNGRLQVWDVSRRLLRRQWSDTAGEVRPGMFLAGGNKLVTTSLADRLHCEWDVTSGLQLQSWRSPAQFSGAINVSPDERYSLALGFGGDVVLRNLAEQSETNAPLEALESNAANFSPDGKLFAVSSDLGYARVWNTATWEQVATLAGVLQGVNSASFSADGKRLVIASNGNEAVKLYDTESWQDVFTLGASGTGFKGAMFSPDGNTVVWGNQTGDLYTWRAPSWEEIAASEAKEKALGKKP
jgi:serine/threonine protein kinase/WD40 repeat protein